MKITTRILADVDPKFKQMLIDLAAKEGLSMAATLCKIIEEKHDSTMKTK